MAKKLYHIKIDKIKSFLKQNKQYISKAINNKDLFELYKIFGKSHYDIAIKEFIIHYKIFKSPLYANQILNIYKSLKFIMTLYDHLDLNQFENKTYLDINAQNDYKKAIFFIFVNFLYTDINDDKKYIIDRLFKYYFIHHLTTIKQQSEINIDYIKMTKSLIKGKNIILKESFFIKENIAYFKILINGDIKVELEGKSIKTLRKKANKKIFFYLLDSL